MIKVLVVDDSGVMRLMIRDILEGRGTIQVVDTAVNGKEALEKTMQFSPDVVLMDMNMGEYDGLYGVKEIMKKKPTPIILLSSIGNIDMNPIMQGLEAGAFDYLNKPAQNSTKLRDLESVLIGKVEGAYNANLKALESKEIKSVQNAHSFVDELPYDCIVIGSSTGGPTALERVITKLPENLPIPIFIAQHMPPNFVPSFAARLGTMTSLNVVVGQKGIEVQPNTIYISPGDRNMIVSRASSGKVEIDYSFKSYKEFNHPSVDALMYSVSEVYGKKTVGVILTGMGRDGADGMARLKKGGAMTIAQNESSCVVFGMPKEAIDKGCVDYVLPVTEIGVFVVSSLS